MVQHLVAALCQLQHLVMSARYPDEIEYSKPSDEYMDDESEPVIPNKGGRRSKHRFGAAGAFIAECRQELRQEMIAEGEQYTKVHWGKHAKEAARRWKALSAEEQQEVRNKYDAEFPAPQKMRSGRPRYREDLPASWNVVTKTRGTGKRMGKTDKYFQSPDGKQLFRSMPEVRAYLSAPLID